MSDFRFANPNWSHAMWIVIAVVAVLSWLDWRRGDVLSRFVSAVMQARLVHRLSRTRRWLSIACLGLAGVSLVVALMRPQWGLTYHETPRVGAQIMVCLDVSKSMLAEDTAPNRLERAKAELTDLLSFLEGDQLGLIAFAGRATVVCPLTPDFGFFKLILDGTGPHSVGRGGTRLEEPIRKALDGFRTESDVSRMLVLITDGEDHDSHPLDAAQAAAERGVKILAIGFGDEAGSEVSVTDPQTGARTQIRDADGRPVMTRLDGDTLREMALATDGAYIPAGTGALDLNSIYDAHIGPLVRSRLDDRGHAVRREAFQWAVLAGFVFFVASIVIGSGSVRSELPTTASTLGDARATAILLLTALLAAHTAEAQENQPAEGPPPAITADGVEQAPSDEEVQRDQPDDSGPVERQAADPRDTYNNALAYLDTDFDRAERMLTAARREAGTDGDVRFRVTYNLGWIEVKRADKRMGDQPQDALAHLRRAADWFRDAVRLRPDETDARHNLEVILRRIIELADSLAQEDERELAERLDALIETQRGVVSAARQVVDRVAAETDPHAVDRYRSDFRRLAVEQRKVLSDGQSVSQAAREELDALGGKQDEQQTPQDKVRAAQLTNLLHYTNRANQRLGQARGQMRRRQAERSFRRAATGLTELKRARDQLRDPVEVLDVILADAASLVQLTLLKASAASGQLAPQDVSSSAAAANPPPWLTREYLEDTQLALTERTAELTARLQAAVAQAPPLVPSQNKPLTTPPAHQQPNPAAERFLTMVREALPHLEKGQTTFQSASQSLAANHFDQAANRQLEAVAALRDARQRFLDLRGLIELAYARETDIQRLLPVPNEKEDADGEEQAPENQPNPAEDAESATGESPSSGKNVTPARESTARVQFAAQLQSDNLDRSARIANLIEAELAALPDAPPDAPVQDDAPAVSSQPPDTAQRAAAQRQQFELAEQRIRQARDEMAKVQALVAPTPPNDQLPDEPQPTDESAIPPDEPGGLPYEARVHADRAVEHLQMLRRLFFSVVEHLRETAQRQAELNDETEQVAVLAKEDQAANKTGPLALRQRELQSIAQQIAQALREQSQQSPTSGDQQAVDPKQLEQLQQLAERFADAGKLVTEGSTEMQQAADHLSGTELQTEVPSGGGDLPLDESRQHQDAALQKLVEALELLQPPQPQQQDQNQQQQDQQDQNAGQQPDQQQSDQDQQTAGVGPSRLLQAVRDREAQRRRDRERRGVFDQEPVEKDW